MSRYFIILFLIFTIPGCSGIKLTKGRPFKMPVETVHGFPDKKCYTNKDLERIRKRLESETGMKYRMPLFTYSTKYRGLYYARYFYPLKEQRLYAGAEVWIECGEQGMGKVYYLLLPLE